MKLIVYNDDKTTTNYEIKKENFSDKSLKDRVFYIASNSKEQNALKIFYSYFSGAKSILFDSSNKILQKELEDLNIPDFKASIKVENIFDKYDFSFLYYTSGSTGYPTAALKTKENISSEVEDLTALLSSYKIKRVIVTVPFIHIYGSLFGLFYPLKNSIDIVLKEHFLPNDLLDLIDDYSLVVTTPLYIKALNKLSSTKDLSKSIFISSTAPLLGEDAREFKEKFNSNIIQIFGSTETGGIAYKYNNDEIWSALKSVELMVNNENSLRVKSPYVSEILYEKEFKNTNKEIQTFDFVELFDNRFKLIGRSSQILKIAGKRYSTIQIENILEKIDEISKALVLVNSNQNSLKDEVLDITLETKREFSVKEIQNILKEELSNLKFSINLKLVDKIKISSTGKKLAIQ
ncbi:aconitate hydratase [Aliarcobacter trophiarum LMG 25534]|uniref:Aconitate hydratase n=1 Tax=Aliarcobacter trophiarum LMG 25534 TaxID=1032241 RepID=A0AAD0QK92_9BACT|nr:AMP-binding protein [Aliarcobacter trophiarum]AXK49073.1 acyl-CoA synthetase / AMP-(fatty) acid ligase [Aliarcobacter trophiarum LMG 25534]RXI28233.1 aconitate hydratase [Aliarcobacter trophiarum]RXJ90962.1 aconitate hydratase [Aliarcobacter trophiarum LMG 25534]